MSGLVRFCQVRSVKFTLVLVRSDYYMLIQDSAGYFILELVRSG
jgi:hypothetical protein